MANDEAEIPGSQWWKLILAIPLVGLILFVSFFGQIIFQKWWTAWGYAAGVCWFINADRDEPEERPFYKRVAETLYFVSTLHLNPIRMVLVATRMEDELLEPDLDERFKDAYADVIDWLKIKAEKKEPGVIRRTWQLRQWAVEQRRAQQGDDGSKPAA